MTSKAEGELDAALDAVLDGALAALARELHGAEPRPGPAMTAGVLADAALTALAREAHAAAPRPGPELVARVLADAAAVAAERPRPAPVRPVGAAARGGGLSLFFSRRLLGWTGGAVAAMVLGLAVGLGLGFEAGPGTLSLFDSSYADPLSLAEAAPGMLFVEGL